MSSQHKHLLVISHRRSGTHLTADTIINNFPYYGHLRQDADFFSIDSFARTNPVAHQDLEAFRDLLATGPCLLKTHAVADIGHFFGGHPSVRECILELFAQCRKIYIHRDGRDVMASLYCYLQRCKDSMKTVSFSDFLRLASPPACPQRMNKVQYWAYHTSGWTGQPDVLTVSYADYFTRFDSIMQKLAVCLDEKPPEHPVNLRIGAPLSPEKPMELRFSAILPRKGVRGDWVHYFSEEDKAFFDQYAGEMNRKLGYA